jgi:hypothetical protein
MVLASYRFHHSIFERVIEFLQVVHHVEIRSAVTNVMLHAIDCNN